MLTELRVILFLFVNCGIFTIAASSPKRFTLTDSFVTTIYQSSLRIKAMVFRKETECLYCAAEDRSIFKLNVVSRQVETVKASAGIGARDGTVATI